MINPSKAQVALEFSIIMAFVIAVFVGFVYILSNQLSAIGLNEDKVAMRNLGETIRNEVLLARSVHANYIRHFPIPEKLNGKNYSIILIDPNDIWKYGLQINISGLVEYFSLPVDVKGQFVGVEPDFLEYCITKGKKDVAISRNQVGLEYACYDEACDEAIALNQDGVLEVVNDREFSLYLMANCVQDFQTASFEINHDGFAYIKAKQAWDHDDISGSAPYMIYGDFMFEGDDPDNKAFLDIVSCGDSCTRITISHAGLEGPAGSDALAELVFKAGNVDGNYIISIASVNLVDAQIRDIPPSKQDAEVTIK